MVTIIYSTMNIKKQKKIPITQYSDTCKHYTRSRTNTIKVIQILHIGSTNEKKKKLK